MILPHKWQIILAKIGIINLIIYCLVRITFLCISTFTVFQLTYAIIFFICELFLLVNAFGFFLTIWNVAQNKIKENRNQYIPTPFKYKHYPSVAVIVAARHEPFDILENTFTTLKNLNYSNKTLYFLDDSTDEKYKEEAEKIALKYSAKLYRREYRHGAKAGIINDFLKTIDEKYLAVFDADQNPMPDFLLETISILENNEKIAFIQTPQVYTNIDIGPVAKGSGMQQAIFYELICEGKNIHNAMFCCGTNVIFRKEALEKVGGFDEDSITEDFSTSLDLHRQGYESYYYNHAVVFGMAPENLVAYFKQQFRWATGTIGIFKKLLKILFKGTKKLTFIQMWEYFLSSTYYFIGWALFILMLSPIINLIFNISAFSGNSIIYFGIFFPYFFISLFLFFLTMKARNYTFSQIYKGIILTYISFPVFMISAVYGLFTKRMKFTITSKGKHADLPFAMLLPYLIMIALSLVAITKGIINLFLLHNYGTIINMLWVVYHLFILLNIFYFNKKVII
jgi:cellulose synthase (UDP-forming)